ncbi:MAG: hypothetical protein HKN26_13585 [Acidimicrobiales bacterium]|nr:hypothetical protein [Acidimicrobiales bacterium]
MSDHVVPGSPGPAREKPDREKPDRERDVIRLTVPATTGYARIARVGAASLAFRWGFGQRQVQDLRLAIDEAVILLMGHQHRPGTITIEYRIDDGRMVIDGMTTLAAETPEPAHFFDQEAIDRFITLAGELLAEFQLDAAERCVHLVLERA